MVCKGCRVCREVQRKCLKNSRALSKKEIEVLKSGGFGNRDSDYKVTLRKLMRLELEHLHNLTKFLRTCLSVYDAANLLQTMTTLVVSELESDPPKLLGMKFKGHWLLPTNQFHENKLLPNFEKVLAAIPKPMPHVIIVSSWLEVKNYDLEISGGLFGVDEKLSPREWLIRGLPLKTVLDLAEYLGVCS